MAVDPDPHAPFQDYAHPERLVTASWLSARLGTPGLKVVESDGDSLLYDIGHIPGAVRLDWTRDLTDPVTRDFIDGREFSALMRRRGIRRDDTVVVYGDRRNTWAAYTLWLLELFGHRDVRLLDGGRDAWNAEERDTSFAVPDPMPTDYPVVERDDAAHRVFVPEVRRLSEEGGETLVDVREPELYRGEPAPGDADRAQRNGHIPGAVHLPAEACCLPTGRFLPAAELRARHAALEPAEPVVIYSHLGARAAFSWFVMRFLLGFERARIYDGSWSEWGSMVRMPVAIGDGDAG